MAIPAGVVPLAEALQGTGMGMNEYLRLWRYFDVPIAVEGVYGPIGLMSLDDCVVDGILFKPSDIAHNVGLLRRGLASIRRLREWMLADDDSPDSLSKRIEREWRREKQEEIEE